VISYGFVVIEKTQVEVEKNQNDKKTVKKLSKVCEKLEIPVKNIWNISKKNRKTAKNSTENDAKNRLLLAISSRSVHFQCFSEWCKYLNGSSN
jgi:hypothetical protein